MDPIDESIEISQEKVQQQQPVDLLENSWFFNNLFKAKKRPPIIPRCYSDPSSSSNFNYHHNQQEDIGKSMEETFSAIRKLPDNEKTGPGTGRRLSSQPAGLGLMRTESAPQRLRKSSLQRCSNNNLSRAPSLPVSMAIRDEIQDDESDFSMSRLIRQASLNHSDLLPPRSSSKVVTQSNSTPKQRTRTKLDSSESVNVNGTTKSSEGGGGGGVRRQQQQQQQQQQQKQPQMNRTMLGRTTSDMGFQEFQSLRDQNIDKIKVEFSSSEKEWPEQRSSSSSSQVTEQWVDKRSAEEDMKAQIKFWARAVASNVK